MNVNKFIIDKALDYHEGGVLDIDTMPLDQVIRKMAEQFFGKKVATGWMRVGPGVVDTERITAALAEAFDDELQHSTIGDLYTVRLLKTDPYDPKRKWRTRLRATPFSIRTQGMTDGAAPYYAMPWFKSEDEAERFAEAAKQNLGKSSTYVYNFDIIQGKKLRKDVIEDPGQVVQLVPVNIQNWPEYSIVPCQKYL